MSVGRDWRLGRCEKKRIVSHRSRFGPGASAAEVVRAVASLPTDESVNGVSVQHPRTSPSGRAGVFEAIEPIKDVDGVTMRFSR